MWEYTITKARYVVCIHRKASDDHVRVCVGLCIMISDGIAKAAVDSLAVSFSIAVTMTMNDEY